MTTSERRPAHEQVGERKLVTMVFADLTGYTALAEMLDPEEVYTFLRPTMHELQTIVESFGGSVPQIQGDGFMAAFGVPVAHEDDAERGVRAALAVRDRVRALNEGKRGILLPEVHAGVNSGEVMVAPSTEAAGFAVVGDTVNTASRLADLARPGEVLVDETTRLLSAQAVRYGPRRLRRAKGKAEPLATYPALGPTPGRQVAAGAAFVDREEILARLGAELEAVEHEGKAHVLVVTGEPGIGKSRLAAELGHSLPPGRLFIGRCTPFGDQRRLAPVAEVVDAALALADGNREAVASDLNVLLLGVPGSPSRTDRDLLHAARLALEAAARTGTVAVVLDDLQWADEAVVEWFSDAKRDPWAAPILLLGLSRESEEGLDSLALPALDRASMDLLAQGLLGTDGAADAVRVPVTRANGNALFLEEMVGMLVERGALRHVGGAWQIAEPTLLDEVPATIRLLIAARLDALPSEEKRVLSDASVCGTVAWAGALEQLGDVDEIAGALTNLVGRGLLELRAHSTVPGTDEYGWKHALIRDVAYRALPKAARADRHMDIAAWLRDVSSRGHEPVGAIAYHYERAWELRRDRTGPGPTEELAALATAYLERRAAEVFLRQARASEAFFRRALRIVDASGREADPVVAARACLGLAEVLIERGAHDEAVDRVAQARHLASRAGDESLVARSLLALGRSECDVGNLRRARRLLLDARGRFESLGDLRGQGWSWHRLSETWGWEGFERELDDLRSAYRCFSRARDRFGMSVAANDLAYILSVQGGTEFHRWYERASRLAEDEGDLRSQASLLRTWGSFCYAAGSFREAADTMAACRPVAADAGDRYAEADALTIGALALVAVGEEAEAERLARDAVSLGRELGSVRITAMARLALARAATRRGARDVATRAVRAARTAIHDRGLRVMHGDLAEAEAMALLDRGAWAQAVAAADRLGSALADVPMALWEPLPALITGRASLGGGALERAGADLETAVRLARRAGASGTLELAEAAQRQAALLRGRSVGDGGAADPTGEAAAIAAENEGIAAWVAGDHAGAIAAFEFAVDRWEALGLTVWLARALRMRAAALRASGDRARAAAADGRADAVVSDISMPMRERATIERPLDVG
ncbi:MAG: adenylate/guanylate cyclase domain-containing protein [Actinomycetota bacterium]